MEGETREQWYPLMGRQANANDNHGDILIVMSFMVNISIINLEEENNNEIIFTNLAKK